MKKSNAETDPFQLIVTSFKDIKNNLIVLMPTLIMLGLYSILAAFVFLQILVGFFIFSIDLATEVNYSISLILYAALLFIIDLVLVLLINSFYLAMLNGAIMDIVLKKKSSFKKLFNHGRTYYKQFLTLMLTKFLILIVPLILLAAVALGIFYVSKLAGILLAVLFGILYVVFYLGFIILTMFSSPILLNKNLGGFEALIESFKYGKSHVGHSVITAAIIVGIWVILTIISMIVGLPGTIAGSVSEATGFSASLISIQVISQLLSSLINLLGTILIFTYIFRSFFNENASNWK